MHNWHCPLHISCKRKLIIRVFVFFSYIWGHEHTFFVYNRHITRNWIYMYICTQGKVILLASIRIQKHDDARRRQILLLHCQMVRRENLLKLIIVVLCMSRGYICMSCARAALLNTLMGLASWKICYVFGGGFECDLWLVLFYLRLNFWLFLLSSI